MSVAADKVLPMFVVHAVWSAGEVGVWAEDGELYGWGTTRSIPTLGLVVEIVEPALLVVKHHRGEKTGKYVNVAVLEGDQVKLVDETASSLPDCPALVGSLLGFEFERRLTQLADLLIAFGCHCSVLLNSR